MVLSPDKKAAKVVKATPTPAPVKANARKGIQGDLKNLLVLFRNPAHPRSIDVEPPCPRSELVTKN